MCSRGLKHWREKGEGVKKIKLKKKKKNNNDNNNINNINNNNNNNSDNDNDNPYSFKVFHRFWLDVRPAANSWKANGVDQIWKMREAWKRGWSIIKLEKRLHKQ